ncbi:FHA domain-containing protein [Agathobaculum butyriciproducens]|nr:FHA domain-containing protein [Agathobaculum butyriciproducens]
MTNQSFPLPAYTNVFLGRSSQLCQIVVNTADISRKHICLCYHAAQHTFVITDYSANGTYNTDGERLIANTSIEVPDGSVFYIGNKQTSFRLSA